MILSDRHRFIFIHIYKNAGTSITDTLASHIIPSWLYPLYTAARRLRLPMPAYLDPRYYPSHIRAWQLAEQIGRDRFNSYFSFAIVRNPWDWQVSLYNYMLKTEGHFQHDLVRKMEGFPEYIRWRCQNEVKLQQEFLDDREGNRLVDFVGRFENLDEDFRRICRKIGLPPLKLPVKNVSNTIPYQEFYDEETREMVRETFRSDIEAFGYEFERR